MTLDPRLRWFALWLFVGALVWLLVLRGVAAIVASDPPQWSPPPSVIVSLTAAPASSQVPTDHAASPAPVGDASPTATLGLPRGTSRLPTRSAAALSFVGIASNMGPGFGPTYLALPQGPGWVARLCGQAACLTRVSTDTGPERWTGRIADLNVHDFERLSGQSWRMGLTTITVTLLRRAP